MIYRIDVRAAESAGSDPLSEAVRRQIADLGEPVDGVSVRRVFLIDTDADRKQLQSVATRLLADPVVDTADLIDAPADDTGMSRIEVHYKPGVMDPVAASTEMVLRDLGIDAREVRTGRAFLFTGSLPAETLRRIAARALANEVIESIHLNQHHPEHFETGRPHTFKLRHVPLRTLTDAGLQKLSREGHLFLSLTEMKAVQAYFVAADREPSDIELETIAQTWSEHCVHKTLKSGVEVTEVDADGKPVGTRTYGNLIKETIFASTRQLMDGDAGEFALSVFKDNAGVVAFDDEDAVCFKVETHNHPSAIEPYGGAATGAGGCIRDVLGTGLAAKPVANTDVFCVAFPDAATQTVGRRSGVDALPRGVIHPQRILRQVVAGVRDYGNRMGIPTVNGAVYFDDRYLGNPLVFCGCVGLIPRDKIHKQVQPGDAVVVMGGRTGRDGIHGATFSSAELTDTHADEFSHAVQIGNAITQKKMADVILQARDRGLFTAITDCGAGGLSSAVGEMGEKLGAEVNLETVPLKYAGLRYDEIWISEAQERMVLSVPQQNVKALLDLSRSEDVEATVIGTFGTPDRQLILRYNAQEVGRIGMALLHDGIPMPTRKATVATRSGQGDPARTVHRSAIASTLASTRGIQAKLLAALSHPNIASKHWVIRQYDHEVQGGSVIKPLVGPMQRGPGDASVLRPKLASRKAVALGCGMAPWIEDPYAMAIAAIDEAIRNVVCVGADLCRTAILDNFCWPSVDDEQTMGSLVAACEACHDAALAYGVPFISGKDSLHNQFTNQETGQVLRIPRTLLISAMSVLDDASGCVTMDLKPSGGTVVRVSSASASLNDLPAVHRAVTKMIAAKAVAACHDISDGGLLVAAAEMVLAGGVGLTLECPDASTLFDERPGQYLVQLAEGITPDDAAKLADGGVRVEPIARPQSDGVLRLASAGREQAAWTSETLARAFVGTLDW